MTMTKKAASLIVGGLSRPSKMPCKGFSIPAHTCNVGSKLRRIPGSTCAACYALKGRYIFPNVQAALQRRFELLTAVLDAGVGSERWNEWVRAMVTLIGPDPEFRWHDSGDLQTLRHLLLIVDVARRIPTCRFWLPFREIRPVRQYADQYGLEALPRNLLPRFSAPMVNGRGRLTINGEAWPWSSEVWTRDQQVFETNGRGRPWVNLCPAPTQGGRCGSCRLCWDRAIEVVAYAIH